ncbi:GNAT family N-acetyltransferase [Phenylobacterium montanum]|uniref:GNAT family N-acetyltransferase n=1 Tax=Phenylobacterium montanum TaxID=2823693 RepID=A0A975FWJ4_9CAUL|nr:GNAT family N-acetyltransferase [Caulobacter sp. S6]QUD86123.1 GNAT family N-acetyltransferase [Caulobacter sp. S6]
MQIRPARAAEAADICAVVRASIIELCVEDHHGDPEILAAWLANKTPENVARWLANPANINLVAVEGEAILAAGCVTTGGEVILNYVSPAARLRGVSTALLAALEDEARRQGCTACDLDSTTTAHRFYAARGYADRTEPVTKFGLTAWPMRKTL